MCGLVGALAFGKLSKKDEKIRQRLMRYITTELMLETEDRGKDATGAAILFDDGNYFGIKRGEESSKFLAKFGRSKEYYGSLLEIWRKCENPVKIFLGHCRKGTIGDKEDNENNHPIKIRNIVGVHNGVIRNDDEIEKHLGCKRDGKVDSEMIFQLFDHFTNSGKEPFTMDMLEQLIARLTGAFAVMAFNADNIHQMPLFRDGRPIELVLIKELSLMFIVSEIKFWNRAHFRYERVVEYGEMNMPSLLNMSIEKEVFSDDMAAIFDLDIRCTKEMKIEDLGEFQKMPRNNKIWTTNNALNRCNVVGVYNGGQSMAKSEEDKKKSYSELAKKAEEDKAKTGDAVEKKDSDNDAGEKKRIFNNITKKYEIREIANPKKLDEKESKIIQIESVDSEETEESKEIEEKIEEKTELVAKTTFEDDQHEEESSSDKLELEDRTDYVAKVIAVGAGSEENSSQDKTVGEVIEAKAVVIDMKSIHKITDEEVVDTESIKVQEVDMTVVDPELLARASCEYEAIPVNNRGYGSMDNLIDDINVKSEEVANKLGLKVISNRVAKVQWIRGFMAGWGKRNKDIGDDDKSKLREKHIAGLKSMVIMLAQFFARTKSEGSKSSKKADETLSNIALDHISKRHSFDVKKLDSVFNAYESGKIREASNVISKVSQYREHGEN